MNINGIDDRTVGELRETPERDDFFPGVCHLPKARVLVPGGGGRGVHRTTSSFFFGCSATESADRKAGNEISQSHRTKLVNHAPAGIPYLDDRRKGCSSLFPWSQP